MKDDTAVIRTTGHHHTNELAEMKDEARKQSDLSSAILQGTDQIRPFRAEVKSAAEAERKARLLEWLSDHDHFKEQHDNLSRYKEGTCMWFLDNPKFKEWKDGTSDTLFCVGMPGAGKTVMSAMIIRHLFETSQCSDQAAVAFLYFRYDLRDTQSTEKLLGSLIKQLVVQCVKTPESIEQEFEPFSKERRPQSKQDMLKAAVDCFSCVYFVIDALDESRMLLTKDDLIPTIRALKKTQIKLFVTSRFIPEIQAQFTDNQSIEITASDADIESYTMDRMSELPRCVQGSLVLQAEIIQAIATSTQGMFLLAKLHIDSLKDKRTLKAMRSSLRTLPSGSSAYDAAYDGAIKRISDQSESDFTLAQQVLTWLVHAMRPISENDLETALAVELGERNLDPNNIVSVVELLSLCAGLVTLDEESKTVRLVHYTTQKYLSRNPQHLVRNPHRLLANVCVSFLGIDDFKTAFCKDDAKQKRLDSHVDRYPFLRYAAGHWEDHSKAALQSASDYDSSQALTLELHLLRHNDLMESYFAARGNWKEYYGSESVISAFQRKTGLQYAASKGNIEHVSGLLELGLDPNDTMYGTTPLFEAARGRHESVVRLLIEAKADVHFQVNESGHTALTAAINVGLRLIEGNARYRDPGPTVALLLDAGADSEHTSGNLDNLTPLMHASKYGMETTVAALCRAGVDVDRRDGTDRWGRGRRTALHVAASRGYEGIVQELLQHGCDPDIVDNENKSPAMRAAERQRWTILELLLNTAVIDLNRETAHGETILEFACLSTKCPYVLIERLLQTCPDLVNASGRPLIRATASQREASVKMLLEAGANPHVTNRHGYTALHIVSRLEQDEQPLVSIAIAQALLGAGLDVDTPSRNGITPLMSASRAGHGELVTFLLANRANVLLKDNKGRSPLALAALDGRVAIVTSLLHAGASLQNDQSCVLAASRGHVDVLRILISAGIDVNMAVENGTTALLSAARNGSSVFWRETVRELLNAGANPNHKDGAGRNSLFHLAQGSEIYDTSKYEEVFRALVDAGGDMHATDKNNNTLFMWSARRGACRLLKLLLAAGLSSQGSDNRGRNAIMLASMMGGDGRAAAVKLLLDAGVDPNQRDCDGHNALRLAAISSHSPKILRTLLRAGMDPHESDANGLTMLMLVASNKRVPLFDNDKQGIVSKMISALTGAGVGVDLRDKLGNTALMYAAIHNGPVAPLLKAGANPNLANTLGQTALMKCFSGSEVQPKTTLFILTDAGADINMVDNKGRSVLILSASMHRRLLHNVDFEARGSSTDAYCEESDGHIPDEDDPCAEAVEHILTVPGLSIDLKGNDGYTALMCAERAGNNRVADLIRAEIHRRENRGRTQ